MLRRRRLTPTLSTKSGERETQQLGDDMTKTS